MTKENETSITGNPSKRSNYRTLKSVHASALV